MGSFYATCSISKMTLCNQKTSIQLLVPRKRYESDGKGLFVSNDGACGQYVPFGFPINGEYDDYGRIDNVVRDKNVEMIEDFFNLSIETVMECCTDDRWITYGDTHWKKTSLDGQPIKNIEILKPMTLTYFRTEVYDYLCQGWENISHIADPTKHSWDNFFPNFIKQLEDNKKFKSIDLENIDLEKAYETLKEIDPEFCEEFNDDVLNNPEVYKKNMLKILIRHSFRKSDERTYLPDYPKNFLKLLDIDTNIFLDDLKKQYKFLTTLGYEMNYILMPSIYGSQNTNFKLLKGLNEKINELLTEDIKYYSEYEDDYDESEEIRKERESKLKNILKYDILAEEKEELLKRLEEINKELENENLEV